MPSTCISQRLNALRVSGTASSSSFVDFGEKCQDCCAEYCFEYGGGRGRRAIAKRLHWAPWMGHSYLGESPRCHIVGSTTLNILQQGWDCNRFLNCASVEKDVGKLGKKQFSLQSLWKRADRGDQCDMIVFLLCCFNYVGFHARIEAFVKMVCTVCAFFFFPHASVSALLCTVQSWKWS